MNVIMNLRNIRANKQARKLQNKVDGDVDYTQSLNNVLHFTEYLIVLIVVMFIVLAVGYSLNTKASATPTYNNVYESGLYTEDSHNNLHLNYNNEAIDNNSNIRQLAKNRAFSGVGYLTFKLEKSFGKNMIKNTQSKSDTKQNAHVKNDTMHVLIGQYWFN